VIGSMHRRLSRWVAEWQSRLRVLLARWADGRCRAYFGQDSVVLALAASAGAGTATILESETRMDTGLWFRQGRVRVVCAGGGLILLAPGRRPCVHKIPFTQLGESMYNAVTGEVLLLPAPDTTVRRLQLDPAAGRELIEAINKKEGEP